MGADKITHLLGSVKGHPHEAMGSKLEGENKTEHGALIGLRRDTMLVAIRGDLWLPEGMF